MSLIIFYHNLIILSLLIYLINIRYSNNTPNKTIPEIRVKILAYPVFVKLWLDKPNDFRNFLIFDANKSSCSNCFLVIFSVSKFSISFKVLLTIPFSYTFTILFRIS